MAETAINAVVMDGNIDVEELYYLSLVDEIMTFVATSYTAIID